MTLSKLPPLTAATTKRFHSGVRLLRTARSSEALLGFRKEILKWRNRSHCEVAGRDQSHLNGMSRWTQDLRPSLPLPTCVRSKLEFQRMEMKVYMSCQPAPRPRHSSHPDTFRRIPYTALQTPCKPGKESHSSSLAPHFSRIPSRGVSHTK